MLDKYTPSDVQQKLDTHLLQCLAALQHIQQTVVKQQWHLLGEHIQIYETKISNLQKVTNLINDIPTTQQQSLQHLYYNQRRVMRLIHQAQTKACESIDSTDKALNKVNRLASSSGYALPVLDSK